MARVLKGSHSFTCTPHVHSLTEWTIPASAFPSEDIPVCFGYQAVCNLIPMTTDCKTDSHIGVAINEQQSAVGRSLSLDQPSGIRFQTSSEMRLRTLFGSHWKHCFSDNVWRAQHIRGSYDNALYKSSFYLLTYLLTYSLTCESRCLWTWTPADHEPYTWHVPVNNIIWRWIAATPRC